MGHGGDRALGWRVWAAVALAALGGCDYFPTGLLTPDAAAGSDLVSWIEAGADAAWDAPPGDGSSPDGAHPDGAHLDGSGPGVLFADDFESGTLTKWTTSGGGSPWYASTDKPNGGLYSAKANKTGAMTYMEASFTAPGVGSVTFAYQRRLVGLEAADDFRADYYDQGVWTAVEQLGSSPASDATFVARSYSIPNTATRIRFGCLNGTTSEACVVDDVAVTAK